MEYIKIFFCLCLMLFSSDAFAIKYYVNNISGKDTYSGLSEDEPFFSITKALNVYLEGDSIWLSRNCSWNEMLIPKNNTTIGAYGEGEKPKVVGIRSILGENIFLWNIYSRSNDNAYPLYLSGCHDINFFFCDFDGENSGTYYTAATICSYELYDIPYYNIRFTECEAFNAGNKEVSMSGGGYKFRSYGYDCSIVGGKAYNNVETNVQVGGDDFTKELTNINFSYLEVYNYLPFDTAYETGINIGWSAKNCKAFNNYIHDCRVLFQFDSASQNNLAYNNVLENGKEALVRWLANSYGSNENNNFYNNTLISNNGELYGLVFNTYNGKLNAGHLIKNNLTYASTLNFNFIYDFISANIDNEVSYSTDYNLYFSSVEDVKFFRTGIGNVDFIAWKSLTGQDSYSLSVDPLLNSDFSLQSNSPCIDAGLNIDGIFDDAFGNLRGRTFDIGAYEYPKTELSEATLKNCTLN